MGTLLDTSFLIEVERNITALPEGEEVAMAAITASELLQGPLRGDRHTRSIRAAQVEALLSSVGVMPFDLHVARTHAVLAADLASRGEQIGRHDLEIAATAMTLGWQLATLDRKAFARVPGLAIREL
ncbi:MAG: PIN domain-containing protein [Chloroflexi bacterium]|nr:PIN domain-containing protein [Chloroflexota bacterium]